MTKIGAMRKYLSRMSDENCIYRMTVIELCRRGMTLRDARKAVRESTLLTQAKTSWRIARDLDDSDWADIVMNEIRTA